MSNILNKRKLAKHVLEAKLHHCSNPLRYLRKMEVMNRPKRMDRRYYCFEILKVWLFSDEKTIRNKLTIPHETTNKGVRKKKSCSP